MSIETIKERIREAAETFPHLQLVVFSGGEAFLLKEDLYEAVRFATSLGKSTRIVTNGFWGKTAQRAEACARKLKQAGIGEINISTGLDHAEWVPVSSVITAAHALQRENIRTLITVEADGQDNGIFKSFVGDPLLAGGLSSGLVSVQVNSWMPFKSDAPSREHDISSLLPELASGCDQVFETAVVTPHDNLSACCGLTLEHIPEMRLGALSSPGVTMRSLYGAQYGDFLKHWIKVDGPYRIIQRIMSEEDSSRLLEGVVHKCQACVVLHQNSEVRTALQERYPEYVDEVLGRLMLRTQLNDLAKSREVSQPLANLGGVGNEAT